MRNPIELGVKAREVNYRLQTALSDAESRAEEMLAKAVRSRRIEERNSPQSRRQRRQAAQAVMGPADQRGMRQIFEEYPDSVVQALQLPVPQKIEAAFRVQARVRKDGEEHNPYIPLAEQVPEIGQIEYDSDDPRIQKLQNSLGVPIRPMVLRDENGRAVDVYDWERPERDGGGRKLTGPLAPPVRDEEGNFVHSAGYRIVMVPNVAGAAARAGLRAMFATLGERPKHKRTMAIIARLDEIAERNRDYIPPDKLADIFSLARARPDFSPHKVVETGLQMNAPKLDPNLPAKLEAARKTWWKRKQPIRITRFKAQRS